MTKALDTQTKLIEECMNCRVGIFDLKQGKELEGRARCHNKLFQLSFPLIQSWKMLLGCRVDSFGIGIAIFEQQLK